MATTARERLARLLDDSGAKGTFSAQLLAPAHLLELEVDGAGRVLLPVRAPQARKLIAVGRQARFGRGEETLTDTTVRDTWEITPDQVTLGGPGWAALMDSSLEHFRDELGLPPATRLTAELHSMLVYGKGQFFLPHQDSEKDDAMMGTLVVSLPSAHTGGELVIEHAGKDKSYRASKQELSFVAFYADCRHQVTPVGSGYRVTLTFNLLAARAGDAETAGPVAELAACLTEHFGTRATPKYGGQALDPPNRLVYLLDHEYTQRGMNWNRLKGADAERAGLLLEAAGRAGCDAVLALAEVKETWDAWPAGGDQWDDEDDYYEDGDEDEEYDSDPGDYELNDLIDDEVNLGWWTRPDGAGGEEISLYVRDHEVCATTPSRDLEPFQSQYEGYMGNYGNTLDRWYRRAAVVVWPRDRAFAARAEAGSEGALREIGGMIASGHLEQARDAAESLSSFWEKIGSRGGLLGAALEVVTGLDSPQTAAMLLTPFRVETVGPEHASGLAAAVARYGEDWGRGVIGGWFGRDEYGEPDRYGWAGSLPALCGALRDAGSGSAARLLTAGVWDWLGGLLRTWSGYPRADMRRAQMEMLSSPLSRLLETADDESRSAIAAALRDYPDGVLECLMPALRAAAGRRPTWLEEVARDCATRLGEIIARPLRADGDWAIQWTGCGCELCDTLEPFLRSGSRRVLEWPLATPGRRHVHSQIDAAALPVRHQTRRAGRPYTLVLTKTEELFTRETDTRHKAVTDLAWLTSQWGDASDQL